MSHLLLPSRNTVLEGFNPNILQQSLHRSTIRIVPPHQFVCILQVLPSFCRWVWRLERQGLSSFNPTGQDNTKSSVSKETLYPQNNTLPRYFVICRSLAPCGLGTTTVLALLWQRQTHLTRKGCHYSVIHGSNLEPLCGTPQWEENSPPRSRRSFNRDYPTLNL